jgi:cyclase
VIRIRSEATVLLIGIISIPCVAQNPISLAEQMAATEITSEHLRGNLYVLYGFGGNIVASIGSQGVLIVDDQFPEMVPKFRAAIQELGGGDIDFGINTHWHYDHADGNQVLGPDGTWLVAHENSREMMARDNVIDGGVWPIVPQPAYAPTALPIVTFGDHMSFHFNGEKIDLLHFGPAHTTGDAAVLFRGHNTVHLGDVFNNGGFPFIDTNNGGGIDGMIAFCEAVLQEIDEETIVVPGHGPVTDIDRFAGYVRMLRGIRERISGLIDQGASLEQIIEAAPTAEWDEFYGDPSEMHQLQIIGRAYESLSR